MNDEWNDVQRKLQKLAATSTGFDEKLSDAVLRMLGDPPEGLFPFDDLDAVQRICFPNRWPEPDADLTYFHEALHHLVRGRGGTREAARSIKSDIKAGKICAVLVRHADGAREMIPSHRWSGENSKHLWWYGEIGSWPSDPASGLIYIALDMCTQAEPLTDPLLAPHVPPFMQLMFDAINHFGLPEAQPKKAELQSWFEAQTVGGVAVSPTAAGYLATFIRPPEAMSGGQKRRIFPRMSGRG